MTYKIEKSGLVKDMEKKLPKKVREALERKLKELAENPFVGKPVKKEEYFVVMMQMIEQRFDLIPDEVKSLYISNPEYFKKGEFKIIMELST